MLQNFDTSRDNRMCPACISQQKSSQIIKPRHLAHQCRLTGTRHHANRPPNQHMVTIILLQQRAEGWLVVTGENKAQFLRDGNNNIIQRNSDPHQGMQGCNPAAQGRGDFGQVDVDIDADTNQIDPIHPLAEQPRELSSRMQEIVRPFDADIMHARKFCAGISHRQPRDKRHLMRLKMIFDGEYEGGGYGTFTRPPLVCPTPASFDLSCSENHRGGEKLFAFAEDARVRVRASKAREKVKAKGFEILAKSAQAERIRGTITHFNTTSKSFAATTEPAFTWSSSTMPLFGA